MGLLTLAGSPLTAQSGDLPEGRGAAECCQALLMTVGARGLALGNALTARPGPDAVWTNPAGMTGLSRDEFRIHNAPTEIDESNTFSLAIRVRNAGMAALSYRFVDVGEVPSLDPQGFPTGSLRLLEHMLLATFATTMAPGLNAGISYKLYQQRDECSGFCGGEDGTATTHAIDFGVQYHPPLWPALQLGASIVQLGMPLQVINASQADPLPTRLRVGAAYEVMHHFSNDSTMALWLSADVAGHTRQGATRTMGAGVELIVDDVIFVRAGYAKGHAAYEGPAVGLGLRYDRFDVGIAKTFTSGIGREDAFQVTFAIGF